MRMESRSGEQGLTEILDTSESVDDFGEALVSRVEAGWLCGQRRTVTERNGEVSAGPWELTGPGSVPTGAWSRAVSSRFVVYHCKAAFYADRGGEFSGEADYGAWHIDDLGIEGGLNGDSHGASSEVQVGGESFTVLNAAAAGRYTVSAELASG